MAAGPEWGYHGSGPGQLAIAMLLAVTDTEEAKRYYPLFRSGVLALIRGDRWTLPVDQVYGAILAAGELPPAGPLFRPLQLPTQRFADRAMPPGTIRAMLKRRLRDAGLPSIITPALRRSTTDGRGPWSRNTVERISI